MYWGYPRYPQNNFTKSHTSYAIYRYKGAFVTENAKGKSATIY